MALRLFVRYRHLARPIECTLALVMAIAFTLMSIAVQAEMSDHEYEVSLRERNRDFAAFVRERAKDASDEVKAAQLLHLARLKRTEELVQLELEHQKQMKRYSMEAVEARDRADEERVAKESVKSDDERIAFVKVRERRNTIASSVGAINSYTEFEINMDKEPESKVSHTAGSAAGASAESP